MQDDELDALLQELGQVIAPLTELERDDDELGFLFMDGDDNDIGEVEAAPDPELLAIADELLEVLGEREYRYESLWASALPVIRKHEKLLCRVLEYRRCRLYQKKVHHIVTIILSKRDYSLKVERRRGLKGYDSWYHVSKLETDEVEEISRKLFGRWDWDDGD